ncbi:transporter substrate-binding domain-containing protein [Enterovibrio sp. ZSDZ35]|uniref:Transporter substrate-binding domain-containing protein n=1 Tax=Enterovibrio qingdaonensis TaxID=2899818 RepID=A0ABT5QSK6_9GAMM|nr:transporter substrate-binding domain-containing protein [Enterovibrio sp. ZSDZ35]MDD1783971.1 transporter substrate-binding domain-containing protein [Enterovibrio sp. ZSDZ35]
MMMFIMMPFPSAAGVGPERLLLTTQEWFPYQYKEQGEMKGPGVESVKCVMKDLKQPYQLTMTKWDKAQLMVEVGSQHGFFLASQNAIRDTYAVFSDPLDQQNWSWVFLSDATDVGSEKFKEHIEVAALFGSNKWFWLHKQGYKVERKPRTADALLELLLNGEVGAILANDAVIDESIKKLGVSYRAISRKRVKSNPLGVYFSRAFVEKYPQFLDAFNSSAKKCMGIGYAVIN